MTDIVTVPKSILQRLEQVQSLASQNRMPEANQALGQALVEIARSQPELCALVLANQLGHRQLSLQQTVQQVDTYVTDRQIFGLTYGKDVKTVRSTTTTTRTMRLH